MISSELNIIVYLNYLLDDLTVVKLSVGLSDMHTGRFNSTGAEMYAG